MAASKEMVSKETGDSTVIAGDGPFEPCLWGDFFVTYTPPSQMSEEWMRERRDELKGEVRRMFDAGTAMNLADTVRLVDTLERLGIDSHFDKEIDIALKRVHGEELEAGSSSSDLHIVALRFRLLRQHGYWVSADVFNIFRDGTGSFNEDLSSDPRSLLSLYNAAHMATPDEVVLDDAIAFAKRHLEAVRSKLRSPMAEQVSRALDIPLPRYMRPLETVHYITEYELDDAHDTVLLELAKLNLNLARSVHLKELRTLSLWWRDLYDEVKLTYARDRIVEPYFYSVGVFPGEENSHARIMLTKMFGFLALLDDTYDVRATFEEAVLFNEALQRWDESEVSILPEYMRRLYIKILSYFKEVEDILEPHEKYRVDYIRKYCKLQTENYVKEAKWFNENYTPSFKEHVDLSVMSTGLPALFVVALTGAGQMVSKDTFDWAHNMPDILWANGEVGRFLNDMASYKRGKNKMDMDSTLECYMKEHGSSGEEATAALAVMVEQAWRTINGACIEMDHSFLPAAQLLVNTTRVLEVMYLRGMDGLTYGRYLKGLITFLFLKQVPT